MNDIVPKNMGQVASVFAGAAPGTEDLASGIQGGFGHIGYKGKVWSIRYRGDEQKLMREDNDGPLNSIEIVIIKASKAVSKIYYESGYVEGSNAAPDCFSSNGVTPDVGAQKKQSHTCAACPKNQWGSRITPEGKQAKACGDSRRCAVVPLADPNNEAYGGPMLLRVPAASLQDLAHYGQKMGQLGYPYFAVGTRVAFDPANAFPKFQFSAIRALTEEEARLIATLQTSPEVSRILAENEFDGHAAAPAPSSPTAVQAAFEQPPQQLAAPTPQTVAPAPVTQPVAQTPAPAPVTQQVPQTPSPSAFGGTTVPVSTTGTPPTATPTPQQPAPVQPAPAQVPAAAPVAAPQAPAQPPVQVAPTTAEPVEAAVGSSEFEAALEDKLGELLPPAA